MISKGEYVARIQKVQDYIEKGYWEKMSVEQLAEVAGFSRYHFNRIFRSILGESPAQYVNRIRLEHSLFWLAYRKDRTLTEIALELGFADSAVFSRAFKQAYGMSPLTYRKKHSTNCKEAIFISNYNRVEKTKKWDKKPFPTVGTIRIETLSERKAIYIRHIGDYSSLARAFDKMIQKLYKEAEKQHLIRENYNELLAIYHDNPEFGTEEQFRTSLCMTVPPESNVSEDRELGVMELEGGMYVVGHFEIKQEQFEDAWDYMYQQWLLTSGYMPRDACPYEVYLNNPEEDNQIIKVDIYVPIVPIS